MLTWPPEADHQLFIVDILQRLNQYIVSGQCCPYLCDRPSLEQRQAVRHRLSRHQQRQQRIRGHSSGQAVLARADLCRLPGIPSVPAQVARLFDHPLRLQVGCHHGQCRTLWDRVDDAAFGNLQRCIAEFLEFHPNPASQQAAEEQQGADQLA